MQEKGLRGVIFEASMGKGNRSVHSAVSQRVSDLRGACGALSTSVLEANVNSCGGMAEDGLGHFLSMVERELGLIEGLLDHGLKDIFDEILEQT